MGGLEALVLAVCIGGYRCEVATEAYYLQTPALQVYAKEAEKNATRYLGETVVYVVPFAANILYNKKLHLKLTRNISTDIGENSTGLSYGFTF